MLLDDGGDATLMVHKGKFFETNGRVDGTGMDVSEEVTALLEVMARSLAEGRMCRKEPSESLVGKRIRRVERLGRGARLERHEPCGLFEPQERVCEPVR